MSELHGLAVAIGAELKVKRHTIAVAESAAGGLINTSLFTNRGSRSDISPSVRRHTRADGLLLRADQVIE